MVYVYFVHKAGDKTMTSTYDVVGIYLSYRLVVEATLLLQLICQHPPLKGVLKYMAEAIISRRGSKGEGGLIGGGTLVTQSIISNQSWPVPNNIVNNLAIVRIFGGGGGGYYKPESKTSGFLPQTIPEERGGGGGGGWMNNMYIDLSSYASIPITIGAGGMANNGSPTAGGTTSFGAFLSANGGEAGSIYKGGNGGAGGGGVSNNGSIAKGGTGFQFGAGGGSTRANGGTWGGGSGQTRFIWSNSGILYWSQHSGSSGSGGIVSNAPRNDAGNGNSVYAQIGRGGQYGGNGGTTGQRGKNGTNTIGNTSIEERLRGNGQGGAAYQPYAGGAGGGYGGRGGASSYSSYSRYTTVDHVGSAGSSYHEYWSFSNYHTYGLSGGGGGYGGNGGNSNINCGGGGGGYGGNGGAGLNQCGGGGGSYGDGASFSKSAGFGGGGTYQYPGGAGICIIQYYTK